VKVVLVTTASDTGGVLTHVLDLATGLAERGHDVVVGFPGDAERPRALAAARDIASIDVSAAVREPADIWHLHMHMTFDRPALKGHFSRRLRSSAIVLTEHLPRAAVSDPTIKWAPAQAGGWAKPGAAQAKSALKRLQVGTTAAVIVVAGSSKDFMVRRYGIHPDVINVIHNGVRAVPAAEIAEVEPSETLKVGAVGALVWRKGFDVLVAAAALARQPWTVDVIGEGYMRAELEAEAALTGGRIRFLGYRDDAADAIAGYEVFCLPTRGEAFPYVTLEAMTRQRPVVTSRVDGISELVGDRESGLLVEPENPAALAAALDTLALDRPLAQKMGVNAKIVVDEGFTLDEMIDRTIAVYETARMKRSRRRNGPNA
jgi:glycosyltransferase involved in cell wall biosynthesis